jgi:signal transduction histidine kinase/ActR/RegA family two-component response regulator
MHQAAIALESKRALLEAIGRDIGKGPAARSAPVRALEGAGDGEGGFNALFARLAALLSEIETRDSALVEAVDALRESRRAADAANIAKSQFLATMSHELRTPLNAVIGYAEILEEDLAHAGEKAAAADAGRIHRAARDLLGLINEVLDFSKIEAGRMEIRYAPADVPTMVADTVETTRHIAEANGNRVRVDIAANVGEVYTDGARLRQCLLNLLSNACKFTENGEISLRARIEEEMLIVDVADTGCGISEAEAERLFQPFVQADGSFTRKQGGTGLGLVITRKLAQLMGGDVSFVSAPGEGSTFTLRVSAAPFDQEATDIGEGPVILAIEDDRSARDLIRRALDHLPFRLRFAATSLEGFQMAYETPPALIVLDIHLPDRSGWDVLSELKADADLKRVPVLVASIDDDRTRAESLGACEHLVKPFDRETLRENVLRYALAKAAPNAA